MEAEDLPRLLALDGDARLRAMLPHLLKQASGEPVPTRVKEVVLRLLDDNASVVDHTLAAWGTTDLGPEYLDKVIGLAGRHQTRASAISRMLGRLEKKPDRVVDLLMDAAQSAEQSTRRAAFQGLRHGVPQHQHDRIADFSIRLLQLRNNSRLHLLCLELLQTYGREVDIPVLEGWAREMNPPRQVRARLHETLDALRR